MSSLHILIIGGGIGGLALGQGLRKYNIPFTIFERDPTPATRAQGYRIRIAGIGSQGLFDCLDNELWDLFENSCADMRFGLSSLNALSGSVNTMKAGPQRGPSRVVDQVKKDSPENSKIQPAYTVDRTMLRNLLLLEQDKNIQFGKSLTRYELTPDAVKAFFADGTTAEGSILIGADGVTSPVRKQLLPAQRYVDSNLRAIYGKTLIIPELESGFSPEAMKNMTIIKDTTPFLVFLEPIRFAHNIQEVTNNKLPQMEDYVYWVFGGATEDMSLPDKEFRLLSGKQSADLTRKLTANWHPSFKPLFELQNEDQAFPLRLLTAKPQKPDFTPNGRTTLLGDAVHAMLPTGGSGANVALSDAALLLRLLVETIEKGEIVGEAVLTRFWDEMWETAVAAIGDSAKGGAHLFGFKGFETTKEVDL